MAYSGAFNGTYGSNKTVGATQTAIYSPLGWTFDASAYNAVYSDSVTTVQPSAHQALMIIKA